VITGKKKYWILWFAFLAIPGSGFLRFDGIPFSSKSEFLVLAISLCGICIAPLRHTISRFLEAGKGIVGQWVVLILLGALVLKFFTFTLLPLGEGFEACYRSIYAPIAEAKCEKSYDTPIINNDDLNHIGSITRMEPKLDFGSTVGPTFFGASATTWRLPFANDFPRFNALWLDRLPFTVQFASLVSAEKNQVLPISFTGEITVQIDGVDVKRASSYSNASVIFVPLPIGTHELILKYKFADLDTPTIPETAPPVVGPWAQLFVGEPINETTGDSYVLLNINGWTFNQTQERTPTKIEVRATSGDLLASAKLSDRADVASVFKNDRFLNSGFQMQVPLAKTSTSQIAVNVFAVFADKKEIQIGKIRLRAFGAPFSDYPTIETLNAQGELTDLKATFSLDRADLLPMNGHGQTNPTSLQQKLLNLLDAFAWLGTLTFAAAALVVLSRNKRAFLTAAVGSAVGVATIWLTNYSVPFFAITPLSGAAVAAIIWWSVWRGKQYLSIALIVPAFLVALHQMTTYAYSSAGVPRGQWWGFPIWRSRDNDWFVTQGYARQIFVDHSLRGGENLFYFQPAVRYLVFLQHLLLGDNDVLFAILWVFALLIGIGLVTKSVVNANITITRAFLVTLFVTACYSLFSSSKLTYYAFQQASEFPAWIFVFLIVALAVKPHISHKTAIALSVLSALTVQFRPNQAVGALVLFALVFFTPNNHESNFQKNLLHKLMLIFAFGTTLSLSLLHNLHYGPNFVLFSSTGALNSEFTHFDMLKVFTDPEIRELVFAKLRAALHWYPESVVGSERVAFWSLQIIWVSAAVRAIVSRSSRLKVWILFLLPLAYLIPLLPFRFTTDVRHIVIIQLAFGLSGTAMHFLLSNTRTNEKKYDAVIGVNYYWPHVSGLTETARMVAEKLSAEGFRVLVVCSRHQKDLMKHEVINGVNVERVAVQKMIRNGPVSFLFPYVVARRAKQAKMLNLHLPMLESGLIAFLAPSTPRVVTYQCDYVGPPNAIGRIIERVLDASNQYAIRNARQTIVSSVDYASQSRLQQSLATAVAIAPPFAVRQAGSPAFRVSDGFHYGFVGRITEEKGITFLIEAFRRCASPEDRLLIAGQGSKEIGESTLAEVQELARLDSRIQLLGFVAEDQMSNFYASLDAFVFPSVNRLEAFGMVQMEAITAGVPVIASNLPGVRTIVQQTKFGIIAEPGDIDDLARAMNEIKNFDKPDTTAVSPQKSLDDYVALFRSITENSLSIAN
jgi:glycosyltransferase involved in cell wall biosynthesis